MGTSCIRERSPGRVLERKRMPEVVGRKGNRSSSRGQGENRRAVTSFTRVGVRTASGSGMFRRFYVVKPDEIGLANWSPLSIPAPGHGIQIR